MSESLSSRRSTLVLSTSTQALITLGWVVGDWRPGPDSVSSRGPADVLLLKFNPDSDHSGLGSGAGARGGCMSRSSTLVLSTSTQALITLGWVVGDWRPGPDSVSSRGPADLLLLLLLKFNPDSDHSGLGSGAGARGGA